MPVVNTRVDARMVHGQVAVIWTPALQTQRIIVANDEAAASEMERASLRMSAPASMFLSVLTVEQAAANLNTTRYGDQRIFLVFRTVDDVKRFKVFGGQVAELTIGNIAHKDGSRALRQSVSVTDDEIATVDWLVDHGTPVFLQTVPNDPRQDFQAVAHK
ncbi:PTS system mannose/fructose/N-acetylgalactosamine-transporter subunit IIB [Lacticaseibacillus absianus]|uniref:PTS system mannose/fructose/N-acetylgalactosamine-transporter subunit IIB n=1 Tax=Lacticaseibacillus absianus TaxID=2729623 RepID=UPI0015C7197B|nr:PTS sugar transporter subunit IIB [Lacticaseibacillus absianus]